jgi:hypothetical protein
VLDDDIPFIDGDVSSSCAEMTRINIQEESDDDDEDAVVCEYVADESHCAVGIRPAPRP